MRVPLLPALCLAGLLCLTACGSGGGAESTPTPAPEVTVPPPAATGTPTPTPYDGPVNPLTGEPAETDIVELRPVAVMLNNLKEALPQLGQSRADLIYEVVAEGGITRMLAVYQSVEEMDTIGSIRSARPYYIELALGHDALFIHAGGSDDAYSDLRSWGVDHFDAALGAYLVEEYGAPYVDGGTGEQVAVTNVIVVQTRCRYTGDSLGHMDVEVVGEGDGWFACGGLAVPIRWSKPSRESPMTYATQDGAPLALGRGRTYVNIVPLDAAVTME